MERGGESVIILFLLQSLKNRHGGSLFRDEFFIFEYPHEILDDDRIPRCRRVYPILLIEIWFQGNSLEEKWHKYEIVLLREFWKYRLIGATILTSEIEWCPHACEKDWDFFHLDLLDNSSEIFLDIGY